MISMLAWISILEAFQGLVIIGFISQWVPFKLTTFDQTMLPFCLSRLKPERELLLYLIVIAMAVLIHVGLMVLEQRRMIRFVKPTAMRYLVMSAGWLLCQGFAIFKILIYHNPHWASMLLVASMVGAVGSRVFFIEINALLQKPLLMPKWFRLLLDGLVVTLLGVWFYFSPHEAKWFAFFYGGLSYVISRFFLESQFLAILAILLFIKVHFYNLGVGLQALPDPFLVLKSRWPELVVFALTWQMIKTRRVRWVLCNVGALALTAIMNPLLAATLVIATMAVLLIQKPQQSYTRVGLMLLMVILIATMIKLDPQGLHQWWVSVIRGEGAYPLTTALWGRNFFSYVMAFIMPVVCVASVYWSYVLTRENQDGENRQTMLFFLAIVGLISLVPFFYASIPGGYYAAALAWGLLVLGWVKVILDKAGFLA